MSLRSKILNILLVVVVLYAAIDNGTLRLFATSFFSSWEEFEGEQDIGRVVAAVEDEVDRLEHAGRMWSGFEAVQRFVATPDDPESISFRTYHLDNGRAMRDALVDVLFLCDAEGVVRWGRVLDPETGEPITLTPELPSEALSWNHPLVNVKEGEQNVAGLMMTGRLPLLIASTPIRDADGEALLDDGSRFRRAKNGFVMFGRFLDQELRELLGAPSNLVVDLVRPEEVEAPGLDREELLARLTAGEAGVVCLVGDDDELDLFASLNDLRTLEPIVVQGKSDRRIATIGRKASNYALLSTLAAALVILFVLLRLLQRIVLTPLGELTDKAVLIGERDDPTIRTGLDRDDELGQLSTEFDRMMDRLEKSRAEVVRTARLAGMSEIASGVLHNVGNVLNSVNVSTNMARKSAEKLAVKDLEMLVGVLEEHADDLGRFVTEDPRGKHLLSFVKQLTESLSKQRDELMGELSSLGEGIEHISDLVRSQQTYAGTKGVFEYATLEDELEAALRICTQAMGSIDGVELVREYDELPSVKIDKHKFMEILVNLIQNARQSMLQSGRPDSQLVLRILRETEKVRVEVQDNGIGIEQENLAKVFQHGFTTKKEGHGFGLHVSANAATEMGGRLDVRSDGPGRGAVFFLELPLEANELTAAA